MDTLTRYRMEREQAWHRLDRLLDRLEKHGLASLSADELEHLGGLYRQVATHLAQVRGRARDRRLVQALNDLVVRAHTHLYRASRPPVVPTVMRFYTRGWPMLLRATWRYHAVAACLTIGGLIVGYMLVAKHPEAYYAIVPVSETRSPGSSVAELEAALHHGRETGAGSRTAFTSFLWAHNTRVGLLAFASGLLAGVPTVLLLAFNGLMLGAMTAIYARAGLSAAWWAWVLPHGITELSAITIAGGAGLLLGHAVIDPGLRTRALAVRDGGRVAFQLAAGTALLFAVAAVIEGCFRQSEASTGQRYGVAAATALLWLVYFGRGRGPA